MQTSRGYVIAIAAGVIFVVGAMVLVRTITSDDPATIDLTASAEPRPTSVPTSVPTQAPTEHPVTPVGAAACPPNMVKVPGGKPAVDAAYGAPEHVNVHDFCIDRYEVTLADYKACTGCSALEDPKKGPHGETRCGWSRNKNGRWRRSRPVGGRASGGSLGERSATTAPTRRSAP
jgi:formylglycine-generating enzyme required for sulfatase activity